MDRDQAWTLLTQYNQEPFHLLHAETIEGVLRYFANELGYEADYWALVGLLHDVDFEQYPDRHCQEAPRILRENGYSEPFIHAVVSHAYGIVSDAKPEHIMEKILFAIDELTGLIGATARMRPSKRVQDLETSSVMKKFKTPKFAAGCSREVIQRGADMLGWPLGTLIERTILAMRACPCCD